MSFEEYQKNKIGKIIIKTYEFHVYTNENQKNLIQIALFYLNILNQRYLLIYLKINKT